MRTFHPFTNVLSVNAGSPAFEALKLAPDEFREDATAAVYYAILHIDATNADRVEEDMASLKFAFDGFGEAKLHRVDEVGAISQPGYIVAIPDDGKPPLMGALTNRVTIQKLPKTSHGQEPESEAKEDEDVTKTAKTGKKKRGAGAKATGKGKKSKKNTADEEDDE